MSAPLAHAQGQQSKASSLRDTLQQHYDAARTFQVSGDSQRAAAEYEKFLAGALATIAVANDNAGKPAEAERFFKEALGQDADDPQANLGYAAFLLQQGNSKDAQLYAERSLEVAPGNARAQYMIGSALYQQQDYKGAKEHLEKAVVGDPKFQVGYLLGITYIKLNDLTRATVLFREMAEGLGDKPEIHVLFAHAYREGDFLDQAIGELREAISEDSKTKAAHYLIAMALLERDGDSGFEEAIPELRLELKVNPDDPRTHFLLGFIALKRHDDKEAEQDLARAAQLDPINPDPLISLGQLYLDSGRLLEAEKTLRKAIAVTTDPSRNSYQVNRAHYALGRILLQTGREEEGKKELQISAELRDKPHPERNGKSDVPETASLRTTLPNQLETHAQASPDDVRKLGSIISELKPALADSFNNLGVIAAGAKDFTSAMDYFAKAGEWDPQLKTLDRNLGMAAFYAQKYDRAIPSLARHLNQDPGDLRARAALALSFFGLQRYQNVIEALRPIQSEVADDTGLSYAYAVSQIKTGAYDQGIGTLKKLENTDADSVDLHTLLGEAFADQGQLTDAMREYRKALAIDASAQRAHFLAGLALIRQGNPTEASEEFRTTLRLNPADVSSKYHLAYCLIELQKRDEAVPLLRDVILQDPNHGDAHYQLGKLQLEEGQTQEAISNLEAGSKLNPDSDYIHYELALAYRREERREDAEREMKVYQALKGRHRGRNAAQQN